MIHDNAEFPSRKVIKKSNNDIRAIKILGQYVMADKS